MLLTSKQDRWDGGEGKLFVFFNEKVDWEKMEKKQRFLSRFSVY